MIQSSIFIAAFFFAVGVYCQYRYELFERLIKK